MTEFWWIDTFKINRGEYYRFSLSLRNGYRNYERCHWSVPNLANSAFVFALREVV